MVRRSLVVSCTALLLVAIDASAQTGQGSLRGSVKDEQGGALPGVTVHSRPVDDGSGRMVYFGHATEHFAHVIQLEGAIASNYQDAQVTYVAMGADMIDDVQVKTGGVDASAPMGTGLNINVITKSGGNTFKGSAAYAYQPAQWNGDNSNNCTASAGCHPSSGSTGGTPTTAIVRQFDAGLGGRL